MGGLRRHGAVLASLSLSALLGAAGCGGQSASDDARPEAGAGQETAGGEMHAEGADGAGAEGGRNGEEGESGRAGGGGSSQSSSVTQSSSGDGSSSIVQRSSGSGSSSTGVKTFSGSGSTTLSFNVEEDARLSWTNTEGHSFSARGDEFSIDSRAGRGEISLEPGDYDDVKVRGKDWTIVVRPR